MAGLHVSRRTFFRLSLLGLVGGVGSWGWVGGRAVELEQVTVALKRLPPVFDGLRVAQLTDFHSGALVPATLLRRGIGLIKEAKPDLILLTGDFVTGATLFGGGRLGHFKPGYLNALLSELEGLDAPLGVFAVLGNHDFWSGKEATAAIIAGLNQIGVRVLRNEYVRLERKGAGLILAGVDDYWEPSCKLAATVRDMPDEVCLLLSHNPDINEDVDASGIRIDLILAGHTHGGQIVLPLVGAPYLPSASGQKYRAGLVRDGDRLTYISRGLGLFFVPLRLNCPPEVTILTLRSGNVV